MILFCFFQLQCCGISTNSTETGKPWESWYSNLKINSGSASKKVRHLKRTNKVSILSRSGITSAIWCMAFPKVKNIPILYNLEVRILHRNSLSLRHKKSTDLEKF